MHFASPGPPPYPPAREPAMRTRRSSMPVSSPRHNILEAECGPTRDDSPRKSTSGSPETGATAPHESPAKQRPRAAPTRNPLPSNSTASSRESTRQSSLFGSRVKKLDQSEQSDVVAALQQNGVALSALHEREKARSAQLTEQVAQLGEELCRAQGTRQTGRRLPSDG